MIRIELEEKKLSAYAAICPPMSRAERRTAKGKMLAALAENAALRAEVEFLKVQLELKNARRSD